MANGAPEDTGAAAAGPTAAPPPSASKAEAVPGPLCLQQTLKGHTRAVASLQLSPVDSDLVASASADKSVRLWRLSEGREVTAGSGGGGGSSSGTGGGGGNGDSDGVGALKPRMEHSQGVNDVAWNPHGNVLASASDDTLVRLWDVETGKCLRSMAGHTNYAYCCQFDPAGRILASGSFDETIRFWDVRCGRLLRETPAHSDPVTALCYSFDGCLLVSGSFDGLVRLWDTRNGHCLRSYASSGASAPVNDVMLSHNAKYYLQATLDSRLRLISVETGRCAKTYSGHKNEDYCCGATFVTGMPAESAGHPHADGGPERDQSGAVAAAAVAGGQAGVAQESVVVASGSEDGSLIVWDLNSREVIQQEIGAAGGGQGHSAATLCITAHPSDPLVLTGGQEPDCTIKVWRA